MKGTAKGDKIDDAGGILKYAFESCGAVVAVIRLVFMSSLSLDPFLRNYLIDTKVSKCQKSEPNSEFG